MELTKSANDFYKDPRTKRDGLQSRCKKCYAEERAADRKNNPEKFRERQQIWHKSHLEYARKICKDYRLRHLEKRRASCRQYRTGVTPEQFNLTLSNQQGKCAICGLTMKQPHADHDHITGKFRGVLCPRCNMGCGHFKDAIDLLLQAALYLEQHQ